MSRYQNIERIADPILNTAGLTAGIVTPDPRPDQYVVYFANGGTTQTRVTDRHRLELEGWARSPVEAAEVLDTAVGALHKAARDRGSKVRYVEDAELPSSLPTGEEGWDRYTAAVLISVRSPSTR